MKTKTGQVSFKHQMPAAVGLKRIWRFLVGAILLSPITAQPFPAKADDRFAAPPVVHFSSPGVKLPGNQFLYDSGFELMDWDGDGLLDVFLPNSSMMAFSVHLNEGSKTEPRFGHAATYPVNLTETEPQTTEHNQTFAVCDLNSDGLFDLVFFDGQLRLGYNTGTKHGPIHWYYPNIPHFFPASERMIQENARFSTGPESMYWNKGIFARAVLTLTVADWDGDGLDDLLICRFKGEAPGVKPTGGLEQWTASGRALASKPTNPLPAADEPKYLGKLTEAPARGLYFYKNVGTKTEPHFDEGVEVQTPDGQSIAAPNPVAADIDGDGVLDLLSTETEFTSNAYRVDWPTRPHVTWFRRAEKGDVSRLEAPQPLLDAGGKPIPAGVMVRLADMRGTGVRDLFVMDGQLQGTIRWYPNSATTATAKLVLGPPRILRGKDFLRFDYSYQPVVADWFGPNSRDLILIGYTEAHCKYALRRVGLFKNVATRPGEVRYEAAGQFTFRGDAEMVPKSMEEHRGEVAGSTLSVFPNDGSGRKRLIMSVGGRHYLFSDLAEDGLTFQTRRPLDLPAERNRMKGWQEMEVKVPDKVRYIRLGNDRNGTGSYMDSRLNVINFEAWAGGKNVAIWGDGLQIKTQTTETVPWYQVLRPELMFTPGNQPSDTEPRFSSWGYYTGPAVITLKEPVVLERIRFLLSDREESWYARYLPFYWQGKLYREGQEQGDAWYQYKLEVSADGQTWTTVADRTRTEMLFTVPFLVDWDKDGKTDLVLGVMNGQGSWGGDKEYRLYRNAGTNDDPIFTTYEPFCDEDGKPIQLQAYYYAGLQAGVSACDLNGDGKLDLVVEGHQNSELLHYQNVSSNAKELRFKKFKELGNPRPMVYSSRYRFFAVNDIDGDGLADVLNSINTETGASGAILFKGTAAAAPSRITDLAVSESNSEGITLQWTKPAGAVQYNIRWSTEERPNELNWPVLPGITGQYSTADEGTTQTALLTGAPSGKTIYVAVKSVNAKQEGSAISDCLAAATHPLKRIVLRNGPVASEAIPEYSGNEATYLDAQKPSEVSAQQPSVLWVRAPVANLTVNRSREISEQEKVILVRFQNLPQEGAVERAELELSTDPALQDNAVLLQGLGTLPVSVYVLRDDWEAGTATYQQAAPGRDWQPGELAGGGVFVSKAKPQFTIDERRRLVWDVTDAVRDARGQGRTSVSLLLRVDYTGKYVGGQGYKFCGPAWPVVDLRPRLALTLQ